MCIFLKHRCLSVHRYQAFMKSQARPGLTGVVRLMVERRDLVGEETYGLAATWLVPQSTRL